jgi:hypothetical protein
MRALSAAAWSDTNISLYQHGSALMQVCTKFCEAEGDFLLIYLFIFAQVVWNTNVSVTKD